MNAVGRRPLVAGNWKMHTTYEEALRLATTVVERCRAHADVEVALIPPFPWIVPLAEIVRDSGVVLGAQTCSRYEQGAYTGEVAAFMLAPFCRYVIVGHSERRRYFGENDEVVAAKMQRVLEQALIPILCVGERWEEREAGQTQAVVEAQLTAACSGLDATRAQGLVVAYEPVWAIGTGRPATAEDAQEVAAFIRSWAAQRFGFSVAAGLRVLYGGSVTAANAGEFLVAPDIDGTLVGGASLDAEQFCGIVEAARAVCGVEKGA